jgi:hypothetical protein
MGNLFGQAGEESWQELEQVSIPSLMGNLFGLFRDYGEDWGDESQYPL